MEGRSLVAYRARKEGLPEQIRINSTKLYKLLYRDLCVSSFVALVFTLVIRLIHPRPKSL